MTVITCYIQRRKYTSKNIESDRKLFGLYGDTFNISIGPIFAELFTFESSMAMGGPDTFDPERWLSAADD
jgi:hypothetical protein